MARKKTSASSPQKKAPGSKPRHLEVRGLMMDLARLTERHEFYFELLDVMAKWGLNTLWWHFVDDEGFALKLKSHPEVASPFAFSKAEMKRLLDKADSLGIEVVPEVETLGHGRYLTGLKQYAHLVDGDPQYFNAICPTHPESRKVMSEIVTEVAELFPSPYLHIGMDEVDLSGCQRCDRRGRGKPSWFIYADHVKRMHQLLTGLGKRMIMWADHVERDPAMLKDLPKDIIACHWQYTPGKQDMAAVRRSVDAGFDIMLAPSMLRYTGIIQPNHTNVQNTEAVTADVRSLPAKSGLGIANTCWTTWRVPRETLWPLIAYTGNVVSDEPLEFGEFLKKYVRSRFGKASAKVAAAIKTLHDQTLMLNEVRALAPDSLADVTRAITINASGTSERFGLIGEAREAIREFAAKATDNQAELQAFMLAAKLNLDCLQNGRDFSAALRVMEQAGIRYDRGYQAKVIAGELEEVTAILQKITDRVTDGVAALSKAWDRTRYPGDPKKGTRNVSEPIQTDNLLGRLARSQKFMQQLTRSFKKSLAAYRKGGPMPGMF